MDMNKRQPTERTPWRASASADRPSVVVRVGEKTWRLSADGKPVTSVESPLELDTFADGSTAPAFPLEELNFSGVQPESSQPDGIEDDTAATLEGDVLRTGHLRVRKPSSSNRNVSSQWSLERLKETVSAIGSRLSKEISDHVVRLFHQCAVALDKILQPSQQPTLISVKSKVGKRGFVVHRSTTSDLAKGGFRFGMISGLGLGCLGLVLFHQLNPHVTKITTSSTQWDLPPITAKGGALEIPATHIHMLSLGSYSSYGNAQSAAAKYAKSGVPSVIIGTHPYEVISDVAVYENNLNQYANKLKTQGVSATSWTYFRNVTQVAAPPMQSATSLKLDQWLSSEMSAMNALTASLSDGAPLRDAEQALQNANRVLPDKDAIAQSGFMQILDSLKSEVDAAFSDTHGGHTSSAQYQLLLAYQKLSNLRGE